MSTGVLPFEELKKQVLLATGFFETSSYTEDNQMFMTSGNHDDAGLSIGNLQYNFGPADRAQEWFKYMVDNHRPIVDSAFGANITERDEFINVTNTYTRTQRVTWADGISALDANGEKRLLQQPYKDAFGNMLISAEGKVKYYAMKDAYYWNPSYELFRHLSCKSRAALASLFDTYVNKGRYYPVNLIQADFDAINANAALTEAEKEAQKIYQINYRGNYDNAVSPYVNAWGNIDQDIFWHGDGVDDGRRGCMANQGGNYYGGLYDPETQFDVNQEPATDEKVGAAPINVNLGTIKVEDIFLGTTPITKLYLGATLIGGGDVTPVYSSRVPKTQFRTNAGSWAGISDQTAVTLEAGKPLWIDCQEPFVGCRTYYTTDGTEPTAASNLYTEALTFTSNTTLKVKTISVFDIAEVTKTLAVTVSQAPTTTISPTATVQNNIPFTVTLTTDEAGAAIKYKLGTSATVYNYSAPFQVNQNSAGVASTNITVKYWAVGASATEAEKSITYDTSGAVPAQPVVTATAGNNSVALSWAATANTTSYTVYRSTASGTLGTALSQYQAATTYTDNTAVNGTTYYYTVQAGNYGRATNSAQVAATPEAAVTGYRYLRLDGFGEYYSGAGYNTTRLMEIEVFSGGVNRASGKLGTTDDAVDFPSGTTDHGKTTGIAFATNGDKSLTNYDGWWSDITLNNNAGNGWLKIDLGASYAFDSMRYWSYTSRSPRFKVWGTNDLADFGANGAIGAGAVLLWDESLNNGTKVCGATAGTNNYIEKVF